MPTSACAASAQTVAEAFEQAALALTAVVTHAEVEPQVSVEVRCEAPDLELLFVEWLNAIIYEMAVRKMLFGRFAVRIQDARLEGTLWGEPVDVARHAPACEPKGATYTALRVAKEPTAAGRPAASWTSNGEPAWTPTRFTRVDATTWRIEPHGAMRVPAVIYADENLIRDMDDKVYEQAANVATLPGIVQASYAMPDAHWGYGFPIGGVAAFDPDQGGVVSAGGVGFDISCGVRTMLTGLTVADVVPLQRSLADSLFRQIPAGVGSKGAITLDASDMDAMLAGGARWAVERGWGEARDLERIEEDGQRWRMPSPSTSPSAPRSGSVDEMGTLGSGNHYLEVQAVAEIFDTGVAGAFGLAPGRCRRHHPLRLARPRSPDRHRVPEGNGGDGAKLQASRFPIASSPARRSIRRSASATWAPCVPRSTARSPTARSSATMRGVFSRTSSRIATCACCSTSRTIPARSRSTWSMANGASYSFIARARPGRSGPVTRACRRRCARSASPC